MNILSRDEAAPGSFIPQAPGMSWLLAAIGLLGGLAILPTGAGIVGFLLSLAACFLAPGLLIALNLFRDSKPKASGYLGWGFVLGVSGVCMLMTLASILDIRLGSWFWRGYSFSAIIGLGIWGWAHKVQIFERLRERWSPDGPQLLLALAIGWSLFSQLGGIGSLLAPPLHDPASHALMAKMVTNAGHVPWFQLPFRATPFFYPPGLAILVATIHQVSGIAIPRVLLLWTNFSIVLASIAAYALVYRATRSRGAGLFAFGFFAFLSLMPTGEFYLAGKNSAVASNFIFLATIMSILRLRESPSFHHAILLAAMLAGLFVMHYENVYFLFVFIGAFLLSTLLRPKDVAWGPLLKVGIGAGGLSLLLAGPWLFRFKWAMDYFKHSGTYLYLADPSPYVNTKLSLSALSSALRGYWDGISAYTGAIPAWLSLAAPLALLLANTFESLVLSLFVAAMFLFHPALMEPLGVSMGALSYDRVVIHFGYVPTCIGAALGLWGLWRLGTSIVPESTKQNLRKGAMVLTACLLCFGGISTYRLYHRVAASPVIDSADLKAFDWINAQLKDPRPFMVPVGGADLEHHRYFIGEAGLYLPTYTDHDVACHFIRIETIQIDTEYQRYLDLLKNRAATRWATHYLFYVRDDRPYYQPLQQWLAEQPPDGVRVLYHEGQVRILEVLPWKQTAIPKEDER